MGRLTTESRMALRASLAKRSSRPASMAAGGLAFAADDPVIGHFGRLSYAGTVFSIEYDFGTYFLPAKHWALFIVVGSRPSRELGTDKSENC
jgi:hypothetical protein